MGFLAHTWLLQTRRRRIPTLQHCTLAAALSSTLGSGLEEQIRQKKGTGPGPMAAHSLTQNGIQAKGMMVLRKTVWHWTHLTLQLTGLTMPALTHDTSSVKLTFSKMQH